MRFSTRTIDNESPIGHVYRSKRNEWASEIEPLVRELAPFPITYDVDSTQPLNFTEFSYTELLGGVYINTQNTEINARIMSAASKIKTDIDHIPNLLNLTVDKYNLESASNKKYPKHVGFMVGHNMFDLVSREVVARTSFENDDFMLKLHPLTNNDYAGKIAHVIGWNHVIPAKESGVEYLNNCEVAYVTTASELAMMAVIKNKDIVNISSFFHESSGVYYPINKLLFREKTKENRVNIINNIISCKFSGIIFPWMTDIEERISEYYKVALEYRDLFRPITSKTDLIKAKGE